MRLLWKPASILALNLDKRLNTEELRQRCDEVTEGELNGYELDKMVRLVREHPAWEALPEEEAEDDPTTNALLSS